MSEGGGLIITQQNRSYIQVGKMQFSYCQTYYFSISNRQQNNAKLVCVKYSVYLILQIEVYETNF